jgi:Helix-turn-helix domain
MTQEDSILAWLKSGYAITPLAAFRRHGCLALHSAVARLRKRGHKITCRIMVTPTGARHGVYRLVRR